MSRGRGQISSTRNLDRLFTQAYQLGYDPIKAFVQSFEMIDDPRTRAALSLEFIKYFGDKSKENAINIPGSVEAAENLATLEKKKQIYLEILKAEQDQCKFLAQQTQSLPSSQDSSAQESPTGLLKQV